MNDNVKAIALRAMRDVLNGPDPDGDVDKMYIPDEYASKFAELLITESHDLIMKHADQLRQFKFETNAKTADSMAGLLLEHFGFKHHEH